MTVCPLPIHVAPMEGLTGHVWRRVHARHFGAADSYWIPFVTPTREPGFTDRQMRDLDPAVNKGFRAVPQLLTRRPQDFVWAARALGEMGYDEVNLNLGCPAGTVVAKGKGSGFLREPEALDDFLAAIFSESGLPPISVKTRVGFANEDEFDRLVSIYNRYPMKSLTVHPRLKSDQYKGSVRLPTLDRLYPSLSMPVIYNGDIVTPDDALAMSRRYPSLDALMIGRGLIADPALSRKLKGGPGATREELRTFTEDLYESFATAFGSRKNAMMRMKEYWFYQLNLFENSEKPGKAIFKSKTFEDFSAAQQTVFDTLPLREHAVCGWYKPL